jgi:tetratricopeptide (TPR) repeat protein
MARQMVDRAIQLRPNEALYYYQRGQINLRARRYAEAKKDFEMGLSCWQYNFGRIPSQADLSNALVEATGCLEAREKAWGKKD